MVNVKLTVDIQYNLINSFMIIPFQSLPSETLNAIIEAFVLTEGTEYGLQEASLTDKIAQVKQQLVQKKAVLVYSELHQTVNILPAEQFAQNQFIDEQSDKSQN